MTVELIDYTGAGRKDAMHHAANVLIFTKSTRLNMNAAGFADIQKLSAAERYKELAEMAKTIPSSWEFADVTFLFSGITRACAQQITRTRTGSYSMQSQRIVDMSDAEVTNPYPILHPMYIKFDTAAELALHSYEELIKAGAAPQDARGVLPMNTQCNLVAKYNFRAFVDLVRSRSSLRTQGEYGTLISLAKCAVLDAWPWSSFFFDSPHDTAINELKAIASELGVVPGNGAGWRIAKAIDLLLKGE